MDRLGFPKGYHSINVFNDVEGDFPKKLISRGGEASYTWFTVLGMSPS